jgi:tRNA pseudouridine38-40 synthase
MKYEDFTSFSKLHTDVKNNICQLVEAKWDESGHRLMFTITADRFLRNMVRAIVGTLMDLGQGKISMAQFEGIIEAKNRSGAGQSVPAHGLYLEKVVYPLDFN